MASLQRSSERAVHRPRFLAAYPASQRSLERLKRGRVDAILPTSLKPTVHGRTRAGTSMLCRCLRLNSSDAVCLLVLIAGLAYPLTSGADSPAAKNVLLIVSDDLKASVLGGYGDPVCRTPHLDRLAREGVVFERAYCQGTWCAPSRLSFMFSRYKGRGQINLGQHFRENGWYSARVGKIYHMRVPGDIVAGTDGQDIPSSWTEKFNSPGLEAETPGDYACLNLNIFTRQIEGRQSTAMPHRMFVSVECDGDGSDLPDAKSATKAIDLLRKHHQRPFFLAVGLIRPHYPMVAPPEFFAHYPWQQITLPTTVEHDLDDIPRLGKTGTRSGQQSDRQVPRQSEAYVAGVLCFG